MWALHVVEVSKGFELVLLRRQAVGGRLGGLRLQLRVHALVTAVLLGVARIGVHRLDPQVHEPHRQTRQARETHRAGKRFTVVAVDLLRQPVPLEKCLKNGPCALIGGVVHPYHRQHIATVGVHHRQRVAVQPVAHSELAFEVHTPDLVGCLGLKDRVHLSDATNAAALLDQTEAFEHQRDRGHRRQLPSAAVALSQKLKDLQRAGTRPLGSYSYNGLLEVRRSAVPHAPRSSRPLPQSRCTLQEKTQHISVPQGARDAKRLAQ